MNQHKDIYVYLPNREVTQQVCLKCLQIFMYQGEALILNVTYQTI